MTHKKNIKPKYDYKSELVKAMDTKGDVAFYGILIDSNKENYFLLPYLHYKPAENGQFYYRWITEGKPFKLKRNDIVGLHPIEMSEIEIIVANTKMASDFKAKKHRLDEISFELELPKMVEELARRKRKE